jgi:DNA replication protein DnaC
MLLRAYLKKLRLPTIGRDFEKVAAEAARTNLPYERYLLTLAEQEALAREENTLRLRIKNAQFPILRSFETFDFSVIPSVPKTQLLKLAQGDWIAKAHNAVLAGPVGTGKTHVAISLSIAACRAGYRVRFFSVPSLVQQMIELQAAHALTRFEKQLQKLDLIVLDELGYVPLPRPGGELLFGICAARYERRSILITTNLEFGAWGEVFGDARMTGAMLDRLTHRCEILAFSGESYRFRQSQQRHDDQSTSA